MNLHDPLRAAGVLALLTGALASLPACPGPAPAPPDGGECALAVQLGERVGGTFVPLVDGGGVELVLGFQGFRMLVLAIEGEGDVAWGRERELELSAFITVEATDVELRQRTRERALRATPGGFALDEYFLFVNDVPASQVVGYEAEIELVVRGGGCVGATRARVEIRDDYPCVDPHVMLDAGALDAGMPDAGTSDADVCEGG